MHLSAFLSLKLCPNLPHLKVVRIVISLRSSGIVTISRAFAFPTRDSDRSCCVRSSLVDSRTVTQALLIDSLEFLQGCVGVGQLRSQSINQVVLGVRLSGLPR